MFGGVIRSITKFFLVSIGTGNNGTAHTVRDDAICCPGAKVTLGTTPSILNPAVF
jgi:hypothetical protein